MCNLRVGARVLATFGHLGRDPLCWHSGTVTERKADGKYRIEWDCDASDWAHVTPAHMRFIKVLAPSFGNINCRKLNHSRPEHSRD